MTERKRERLFHRIDREHPLTKLTLSMATTKAHRAHIDALLRLLEATVPIQQIWVDAAEKPGVHAAPFEREPPSALLPVLRSLYAALIADDIAPATAIERLSSMEPFSGFPELLSRMREEFTP